MPNPFMTRLNKVFRRQDEKLPELAKQPEPEPSVLMGVLQSLQERWAASNDRKQKYLDYRDMDREEFAAMLNALANSVVMSEDGNDYGFGYMVEGRKYKKVLDRLVEDTDLNTRLRDFTRQEARDGDLFLELVPDKEGNIRRIKALPPASIIRNEDKYGTLPIDLKDGEPYAFEQISDAGKVVAGWFPWEIVHARWEVDGKYGRSFLEDYRAAWKKLRMMEESLILNRLFRSFPRLVHYVDITGKTTAESNKVLKSYQDSMTQRRLSGGQNRNNPLDVLTDIFVGVAHREDQDGGLHPSLSKLDLLDPSNTAIDKLGDFDYMRSKYFTNIGAESFGLAQRQGMSDQDLLTARLYRLTQERARWMIKQIFDTQLRLKGFDPRDVKYEIKLPRIATMARWLYADALFRTSLAWKTLDEVGATNRYEFHNALRPLTEAEFEELLERRKEEDEKWPRPDPKTGNGSSDQLINGNRSTDTGAK